MSELAIVDSDAFEKIKQVADLYVEGTTSPYAIARRLGIKVVEAKQSIEHWHEIIREDSESRDLAKDSLHVMLQRYDRLLDEANKNLENLKTLAFDEKVSAQINTTIKNIGDLDAKRVDALQKAGLLDAHDLGDELAEREEREELLINILRNHVCDNCRPDVMREIQKLSGKVEPVRDDGNTIDVEVMSGG